MGLHPDPDPFIQSEQTDVVSFLSSNQNLSINTDLQAANGKRVKALDIFAYALAFFREQALKVAPPF